MRVLITGGLGYLGHAVRHDLLEYGHEVTILSHRVSATADARGAEVVQADLRDRAAIWQVVRDGHFDCIVHLAGLARARESFEDPLAYFHTNVSGTVNLLLAVEALPSHLPKPRLVYASTTLVYGSNPGLLTEDTPPAPQTPYADTKTMAERIIQAHAAAGNIAATILRIFNVGGGVDGVGDVDHTRVIPALLRTASGLDPHFNLAGDGTTSRDFVHVADAAAAVRHAIAHEPEGCDVVNVAGGAGISINDLIATTQEVTGVELRIERSDVQPQPQSVVGDIGRARELLGWEPRRSDVRSIITDAWACWNPETAPAS